MSSACRDIYKAIHENKWLSIEYQNQKGEITRFWIGIKKVYAKTRRIDVEGLHLSDHSLMSANLSIDTILSSNVVEGSYFAPTEDVSELVLDLKTCPEKYASLFDNVANLKILDYLSACNKLDSLPYKTEYSLIKELDADQFVNGKLKLSDEQFGQIVNDFQKKAEKNKTNNLKLNKLVLNCISINTNRGLYVLAYRNLYLDVVAKSLVIGKHIVLNREFALEKANGKVEAKASIMSYLDPADHELLDDMDSNLEAIKDSITRYSAENHGVDDMPYAIAIGYDVIVDLDHEYKAIHDMYSSGQVTTPIKAFFGNMVAKPRRTKNRPLVLLGKQFNLDQMLAINNAVKYPLTYVQGPPGTGKTKTILYTILSAFYNEQTVLFSTANNHPIDEVVKKLRNLDYKGVKIPFPVLRIGSREYMLKALDDMRELYNVCADIQVFNSTLDNKHDAESQNMEAFAKLMDRYERLLDLKDRRAALKDVLEHSATSSNLSFRMNMTDKQLPEIEKNIDEIGEITDKLALSLLPSSQEELLMYLFYTSAKYIKRLGEPKNNELKEIVFSEDREEAVDAFIKYLTNETNIKKLQRIFPVISVTTSSAYRIGPPKPYFDLTIMDEASQCDTAVSLMPIIRGNNLMLVGDPQQLNPVVILDEFDNEHLKKRYNISDEYDYVKNSIYKTFLACDSVSDEILLRNHYRCNKKIINFNNRKYYNDKLVIQTESKVTDPLKCIDVAEDYAGDKNTAPKEVAEVLRYVEEHPDKSIGIITPFAKQKELIGNEIEKRHLEDRVSCGTVHTFQGDEKDVILLSLALTNQTKDKTYDWLKNNKELINVATSRAKDQLIVVYSEDNLERLHKAGEDDLYELVDYVRSNGDSKVSSREVATRALGVKPYSSKTEEAFLTNLNHAMSNILMSGKKCSVEKEVSIAAVFEENYDKYNYLFYSGRFDFVVYEKEGTLKYPILAIELDGKEHLEDETVRERDRLKEQICAKHGFQLIRVDNTYARRYNYIKDILETFFKGRNTVVTVRKKRG